MKEQFVTYEIALALKELGFDEKCIGHFYKDKTFAITAITSSNRYDFFKNSNIKHTIFEMKIVCVAPLWQQAIDWFRENYNMDIYVNNKFNHLPKKWLGIISIVDEYYKEYNTEKYFNNFYDAREQAILKAIELCEKKK